jgi:hypothetical protein
MEHKPLIPIDKLTDDEIAALAPISLAARPGKTFRREFERGVKVWRNRHHLPLVYGRAS